ncbi:DUF3460 family protein [Leeia sp. TBRC 13508]|uniref:DUF3460 family protein n=1 Tax=Leeia speluncae TaxID=2884804 RepID=A0ABS8D927_9NEIS|nr:DUF3460 family protein [Leeia speluncae]MCB6184724.1 DUF3460 family protein [Leeia speluncae]
MYKSEFSSFMESYLEKNKEVADSRLENRAVWWDKPVDAEFEKNATAAKVKQNGYYYQGYFYRLRPKKEIKL